MLSFASPRSPCLPATRDVPSSTEPDRAGQSWRWCRCGCWRSIGKRRRERKADVTRADDVRDKVGIACGRTGGGEQVHAQTVRESPGRAARVRTVQLDVVEAEHLEAVGERIDANTRRDSRGG